MNLFTKLYAWACERLYYEFAGSYDWVSWLVSMGRWAAWRRVALDYLPTAIVHPCVLEIGFGTGELLLEMARQGINVVGLERSPAMHKITSTKLHQRVLSVPRIRALAQSIPLVDASFDAIVATFPAPYILEAATLRECIRLLRAPNPATHSAGGRLVIVGLWVSWNNPLLGKLAPFFYGAPDATLANPITQRLAQAGFSSRIINHKIGLVSVGMIVGERLAEQQ